MDTCKTDLAESQKKSDQATRRVTGMGCKSTSWSRSILLSNHQSSAPWKRDPTYSEKLTKGFQPGRETLREFFAVSRIPRAPSSLSYVISCQDGSWRKIQVMQSYGFRSAGGVWWVTQWAGEQGVYWAGSRTPCRSLPAWQSKSKLSCLILLILALF